MTDTQALLLRAFLAALSQAQELPAHVADQLRDLARDLERNLDQLDQLATNSPSLQPAYQLACDALANEAAERGMGLDFITAEADPNERSTAIGNEIPSANAAPAMTEVLAKLKAWDKAQLEAAAPKVFNTLAPRSELFSLLGFSYP